MTSTVLTARTDDGTELPILNVTDPTFGVVGQAELDALGREFLAEEARRRWVPAWILRAMTTFFLRQSVLGRGLLASRTTFLPGLTTYMMKIPVALQGPWATPLDRRLAMSVSGTAIRARLQQVAGLLAEGLAPALRSGGRRPLHLVSIAGGPAADTWNCLLLLRRDRLLDGRPVRVDVLDADATGPSFGRNVYAVLGSPGGGLHGLDVTFKHVLYDWNDPSVLVDVLSGANKDAVVAVSSEGGLFEYGTDDAILANLAAVAAAAPTAIVVGSVTRADDDLSRRLRTFSRAAVIPRTVEGFDRLAARAGWAVDERRPAPLYWTVRLYQTGEPQARS